MKSLLVRVAGSMVLLAITSALLCGQPPEGLSNWSFDEITLVNGNKFQGLILSELPEGVRFKVVSRPPGRPTVIYTDSFSKTEISSVKKLAVEDRKVLQERIEKLETRGEGERLRMESLEIVAIDWMGNPGAGKRYESGFFVLESNGSEELMRRSAVRLEQIYVAFNRFLPLLPSARDDRRTLIRLATDKDDYKTMLGSLGETQLLNPAVFDPKTNTIICWNELKRLSTELQTARLHHSQQLATLKQYEERVSKLYKKDELERYLNQINLERKRVWTVDLANGKKFDQATARLFAILYHEAFHAYVGRYVYPPLKQEEVKAGKGTGELPRWLNEGLAQVFETAVVEAGELRADTPDRDRLLRAKDWLKGKGGAERLVPLNDLLTGKDPFLAFHTDQKAAANRSYLTSWALAYYLTFDRHLIGATPFKKYLIDLNSGGDPRETFEKLVGKDLASFEKDWHAYLLRLQSDGTMGK